MSLARVFGETRFNFNASVPIGSSFAILLKIFMRMFTGSMLINFLRAAGESTFPIAWMSSDTVGDFTYMTFLRVVI
jgi:hypothetical protein